MSMPSSRLRRGDQRRQPAVLELLLDEQALLARERAVVGADESSPASSLRRSASRSASRRLLTKTIVRAVGADQLEDARVDLGPDRAARSAPAAEPPGCCSSGRTSPIAAMSSTGTTTSSSSGLRTPASTMRHRPRLARLASPSGLGPRPPRKPATTLSGRCVAERPMRCGGFAGQRLEPLERQRQVRAALRAGQGVDLVDDDPLDAAQRLARLRGEQQVERLGRRDEDVRRPLAERAALLGRRVAGAHRDVNLARQVVLAAIARRQRDAGQRRTKVAVDVVDERLERRDVENAQAAQRIVRDAARSSAGRGTTGTRRASCRSRSARR